MRDTWKDAYRLHRIARKDKNYRLPQWVYGPDPDCLDTHPLHKAWMIANWDIQPYPLDDRLRDYKLVKQRYKDATGLDGPVPWIW